MNQPLFITDAIKARLPNIAGSRIHGFMMQFVEAHGDEVNIIAGSKRRRALTAETDIHIFNGWLEATALNYKPRVLRKKLAASDKPAVKEISTPTSNQQVHTNLAGLHRCIKEMRKRGYTIVCTVTEPTKEL